MKREFPQPQSELGVVEVEVVDAFFIGEGKAFARAGEGEARAVAADLVGAFAVAAAGGEVFPEEVEDCEED